MRRSGYDLRDVGDQRFISGTDLGPEHYSLHLDIVPISRQLDR